MDIQARVIGIVFAICAGMLFFWAIPRYVLRTRRKPAHSGGAEPASVGMGAPEPEALAPYVAPPAPLEPPPIPKGKVSVYGFNLFEVVGISLFFGFYTLLWAAGQMIETKELSELDNLPLRLLETLLFQFFQIFLVCIFLFRRVNLVQAFGLRWRKNWWLVLFSPCVVLMMWAFMAGLEVTGYNSWIKSLVGGDAEQDAVKLLRENSDPASLAMMAIVACIGAPLAEEVVFRGYIYPAVKRFTNIPFAVVFSGLLFGAVHGNLAALLPLTVLGVLLVLAYEYTGSLWAPIAIHFCFNAATTVVQIAVNLNPELLEEAQKHAGLIPIW